MRRYAIAAALAVLTILVYLPIQNHPWLWDDDSHIVDNVAVVKGVPLAAYFFDAGTTTSRPDYNQGIYRPLRNLSYRATAVLFGVRPGAFEAVSLALYALLSALVFLALLALTGNRFAATTAALLWMLMPVHVQAVAYPAAMGDVLSAVLEVAALASAVVATRRRSLGWGALSLLLAAASMFAKEIAVTEPLILALLLWLDAQRKESDAQPRRRYLLVLPHLAVALGYVVMRSLVVGQVAQRGISRATVAVGLVKAPILLVEYLRLSLTPIGHSAFYTAPSGVARLLLALGILALLALVTWRLQLRAVTVGLAAFAVALLPVLQLVPIIADLADRFVLFASIGLALAVAALLTELTPRRRPLAIAVAAVAAILALGGTLLEQRMWRSDAALWAYSVDREPEVGSSHGNLANALLKEGRPAEALVELDRARELGFDFPYTWVRRARALDEMGRTAEAIAPLRAALHETPSQGQLHALLGDLYRRTGHQELARAELAVAEKLAPTAAVTLRLRDALK